MIMTRKAAAAAIAMALSSIPPLAFADEPDTAPARLVCTFSSGSSISYEGGKFVSTAAMPLSFTLTKIDLEAQTAALTAAGSQDAVPLRLVRAVNANHFLEVVNEGFLNLTTVYDKDPATGLHPAVHSRHLGLVGQPVFGQYTGTCSE